MSSICGKMSILSERMFLLRCLEVQIALAAHVEEDDESVEELGELHAIINDSRYINNRVRQPRSVEFLLSCALNLSPTEFKKNFRCDLQSLQQVVMLISPSPVFHNNSYCAQTAVTWQVCVALWFLGHNENGVATAMESMLFGFGVRTIPLFIARVVRTLLQVRLNYLLWPHSQRRLEIAQVMEVEGFLGCVDFVDGTTIPLAEKPSLDGECYFDRKHRYSVNMQVVCDIDRRIIAFSCGEPGSYHDVGVWRQSPQELYPDLFFSSGQYLIGDSAYGLSRFLIPTYKYPAAEIKVNSEFNFVLAKSRVWNEHCIGILKGIWSYLREHRHKIRVLNDVNRIIRTVTACVILHNMLANLEDSWDETFDDVVETDVCLVQTGAGSDLERVQTFREAVKAYAVGRGYQNGILLIVG